MFRFVRQIFISALMYFGNLWCVNPLKCISMKNQECKVMILYLTLLVLRQINVVATVIILVIHMQEFVSQML